MSIRTDTREGERERMNFSLFHIENCLHTNGDDYVNRVASSLFLYFFFLFRIIFLRFFFLFANAFSFFCHTHYMRAAVAVRRRSRDVNSQIKTRRKFPERTEKELFVISKRK